MPRFLFCIALVLIAGTGFGESRTTVGLPLLSVRVDTTQSLLLDARPAETLLSTPADRDHFCRLLATFAFPGQEYVRAEVEVDGERVRVNLVTLDSWDKTQVRTVLQLHYVAGAFTDVDVLDTSGTTSAFASATLSRARLRELRRAGSPMTRLYFAKLLAARGRRLERLMAKECAVLALTLEVAAIAPPMRA